MHCCHNVDWNNLSGHGTVDAKLSFRISDARAKSACGKFFLGMQVKWRKYLLNFKVFLIWNPELCDSTTISKPKVYHEDGLNSDSFEHQISEWSESAKRSDLILLRETVFPWPEGIRWYYPDTTDIPPENGLASTLLLSSPFSSVYYVLRSVRFPSALIRPSLVR